MNPIVPALLSILLTPPFEGPGLRFVDVGQGAALIVRGSSGDPVVIDSGPPGGAEALIHALTEEQVERVALWIHTHHDADHIGGFALALAGLDGQLGSPDDIEVEALWDRGLEAPVPETEALALVLELAEDRRTRPPPGSIYAAPDLRIEVLELDPPPLAASENDRALALCLEVGSVRALIPADLGATRAELAAQACGPVDLLWLGHHGAAGGTSAALLELADPRVSVISAGHDNGYCHPAASVVASLAQRRLWILDGAGFDPRGPCPPLASVLGPDHVIVGGDLWLAPDSKGELDAWLGNPGAEWTSFEPSS